MRKINSNDVCSYKYASTLDSGLRRKLLNPSRILASYVKPGMEVLDLGCGNGFCTFDIADLLNGEGKVVAADLQQEMLDLLEKKMQKYPHKELISLHKCEPSAIGLNEKFDFILLFFMLHEMPDKATSIAEIKSLLKPDGKILIVEPKFHVTSKDFSKEAELLEATGMIVERKKDKFISRVMEARLQ